VDGIEVFKAWANRVTLVGTTGFPLVDDWPVPSQQTIRLFRMSASVASVLGIFGASVSDIFGRWPRVGLVGDHSSEGLSYSLQLHRAALGFRRSKLMFDGV